MSDSCHGRRHNGDDTPISISSSTSTSSDNDNISNKPRDKMQRNNHVGSTICIRNGAITEIISSASTTSSHVSSGSSPAILSHAATRTITSTQSTSVAPNATATRTTTPNTSTSVSIQYLSEGEINMLQEDDVSIPIKFRVMNIGPTDKPVFSRHHTFLGGLNIFHDTSFTTRSDSINTSSIKRIIERIYLGQTQQHFVSLPSIVLDGGVQFLVRRDGAPDDLKEYDDAEATSMYDACSKPWTICNLSGKFCRSTQDEEPFVVLDILAIGHSSSIPDSSKSAIDLAVGIFFNLRKTYNSHYYSQSDLKLHVKIVPPVRQEKDEEGNKVFKLSKAATNCILGSFIMRGSNLNDRVRFRVSYPQLRQELINHCISITQYKDCLKEVSTMFTATNAGRREVYPFQDTCKNAEDVCPDDTLNDAMWKYILTKRRKVSDANVTLYLCMGHNTDDTNLINVQRHEWSDINPLDVEAEIPPDPKVAVPTNKARRNEQMDRPFSAKSTVKKWFIKLLKREGSLFHHSMCKETVDKLSFYVGHGETNRFYSYVKKYTLEDNDVSSWPPDSIFVKLCDILTANAYILGENHPFPETDKYPLTEEGEPQSKVNAVMSGDNSSKDTSSKDKHDIAEAVKYKSVMEYKAVQLQVAEQEKKRLLEQEKLNAERDAKRIRDEQSDTMRFFRATFVPEHYEEDGKGTETLRCDSSEKMSSILTSLVQKREYPLLPEDDKIKLQRKSHQCLFKLSGTDINWIQPIFLKMSISEFRRICFEFGQKQNVKVLYSLIEVLKETEATAYW